MIKIGVGVLSNYRFNTIDEIYSLVSQLLNINFFVYKNSNQVR